MEITKDKLDDMLNLHRDWCDSDGKCGKRFEFHGDLCFSDLSEAKLNGADLKDANLNGAILSHANLSEANLNGATLINANLPYVNLIGADLSNADLFGANLFGVDLRDVKGLMSKEEYLDKFFEKTDDGYVVYKVFGLFYDPNPDWVIEPGSVIEEPSCDMDRRFPSGAGINVAAKHYLIGACANGCIRRPIWRCLIRHEWLDGVCAPYTSASTLRCNKLQLIETI